MKSRLRNLKLIHHLQFLRLRIFQNDLNVLEASLFRTDSSDVGQQRYFRHRNCHGCYTTKCFTMSDDISGHNHFHSKFDDGVSTVTFQITDLMNESLPKWENDLKACRFIE